MNDVNFNIRANDKASAVLDKISHKLGIFSKQGISMGMGFSVINKSIDMLTGAFQSLSSYIADGIELNRQYELSMAQLSNTIGDFGDETIGGLSDKIKTFSVGFGMDMNEVASSFRRFIQEGADTSDLDAAFYHTASLFRVFGEDFTSAQEAVITGLDVFDLGFENAGYVAEKYNEIIENTGLSLSQINRLIGGGATEIRASNISFDQLVDVLYTLDNTGTNAKNMLSDLKTVLNDFPDYTFDAAESVDDLNTKLEKIMGTASMTAQRLEMAAKISQTEVAKGFDYGAYFDKGAIDDALLYTDRLKEVGIDTYEEFKRLGSTWAMITIQAKYLQTVEKEMAAGKSDLVAKSVAYYDALKYEGMILDSTNPKITEYIGYLLLADQIMDEMKNTVADTVPSYATLSNQLKILKGDTALFESNLDELNKQVEISQYNIRMWSDELKKLELIHPLEEDLRYMSMALIDASYAANIHNSATRELITSIIEQEDAIKRLTDANKLNSIEESKYNLEVMKIQYAAMDKRGRLTRSQRDAIKRMEKETMRIRIESAENQIAIDEKTLTLDPYKERLESLRLWYNEEIYTIQDAYNTELNALNEKIRLEDLALQSEYNNIADINADIIQNSIDTYNKLKKIWQNYPAEATTDALPTPVNPNPPNEPENGNTEPMPPLPPWFPKLQHGTPYVPETGPYLLHKGERVIPSWQNGSIAQGQNTITIKVAFDPIQIYADINNKDTIETFTQKMASATRAGLIKGIEISGVLKPLKTVY